MKPRTAVRTQARPRTCAAALLACTLAACSDDVTNPVAPSSPGAAPEPAAAAASEPTTSGFPAAAPAVAEPLEPPSIDIDPPMRFDLPRLPSSWFERPSFPAAGHRRYTGLRIVTDAEYPGRIDQHRSQKLWAVITRNDGVSATSGADWRTGNTHVATVDQHGRVTARNPGRFDTIATARGLEARMTGMEVHPGPGRAYNDRFWQELVYNEHDYPGGPKEYIYTLDDPLPGFYLWLGDPSGRRVASDSWISWARRNIPRAVEALTGERYHGRIEGGLADRDERGWITIVFDTPPHEDDQTSNFCGRARVGENPGRIKLYLDNRGRPQRSGTGTCGTNDTRAGNWFIKTILHEIGHAMGFLHVRDQDAIMRAGEQRTTPAFYSAAEQYHARLSYRIGRGWRDYCGWPLRVACGDLPRRGAAPRMLTLP